MFDALCSQDSIGFGSSVIKPNWCRGKTAELALRYVASKLYAICYILEDIKLTYLVL